MHKREVLKKAYELTLEAGDCLLRALEYDFNDATEIGIIKENAALATLALLKALNIIANEGDE